MTRSNRSNIDVLGRTETWQRDVPRVKTGYFKKMWKTITAAFDMTWVVSVYEYTKSIT